MTTQSDIIEMLKQGDSQRVISSILKVSPKTIVKARKVYNAQCAIEKKRESQRESLYKTIPTNGTKINPPKGVRKVRESRRESVGTKKGIDSFIHVNQFKTWLLNVDRSKFHDSSASAIKRLVDHKRMAFLEGYVALINEYLEGV